MKQRILVNGIYHTIQYNTISAIPSSWTCSSSKIAAIFVRFRQHQYAISADIEEMFLQVGVSEKDQPSLRFLWRETPSEVIKVYEYTRHIFGAKDSPTCANYALNRTGVDNAAKFPEAAPAVKQNFHMYKYLDSRPTLEGIE